MLERDGDVHVARHEAKKELARYSPDEPRSFQAHRQPALQIATVLAARNTPLRILSNRR
jgi:hypothetical protein